MNLLMQFTSSSRIWIRTLIRILNKKVSIYKNLSTLNCNYKACRCLGKSQIYSFLVTILFNISLNNFSLMLNRRENMKMVTIVKIMKYKIHIKVPKVLIILAIEKELIVSQWMTIMLFFGHIKSF